MTETNPTGPIPTRSGPAAPAVRLVDAVKTYGSGQSAVRALDGVSLTFDAHRFTAVMGPSGSGKSTLLHCAAGLDQLTSGSIVLGGELELGGLSETERTLVRRDRIGFVFQAFNLLPTLSALENIELPARLAGRHPDRARLDQLVELTGLGDRLGHRPAQLSGGQQQRVAIARALATDPDLVVADEPTGSLDSAAAGQVLALLRRTTAELGGSVVMVTHDPAAAAHADRVVFLRDGRLADDLQSPGLDQVLRSVARLAG